MDIKSLLSPQETPRNAASSKPAAKVPTKKSWPSRTAKVAQPSPLANTALPPTLPRSTIVQAQHCTGPPSQNISPGTRPRQSSTSSITPPADGSYPSRLPSTPGMDTLAELASMQHDQQAARANAVGPRSQAICEHPAQSTSTPTNKLSIPNAYTSDELQDPSQLRVGSTDTAMSGMSAITPPRKLSTAAVSEAEYQTILALTDYLVSSPFIYDYHVALIDMLHKGFVNHMQPSSSRSNDPHTYELLDRLHAARTNMAKTFALGENLWADWMQDQILLAKTFEDHRLVVGMCNRAVSEEPSSTKLWLVYGEYMLSLYNSTRHGADQRHLGTRSMLLRWPMLEGERLKAQKEYTWLSTMSVWDRAIQQTKWNLHDSHILWDPFVDFLLQDAALSPTPEALQKVQTRFVNRLETPHSTWNQTFQAYSMFISAYNNGKYEEEMNKAIELGAAAKVRYSTREVSEINILRAQEQNDRNAEFQAFTEYLQWEMKQSHKRGDFDFALANALYERFTLRFPVNIELWEAHVMLVNEEIQHHPREDLSMLPVLAGATTHCPWSGSLWFQYLLAAENAKLSYKDIELLKHKATSNGMLDAGGMDEVLKVHTAWCGFLRRRAFSQSSTDEEMDMAEIGIPSAIEDMETLGRQKYGKDYPGDPEYRLEKIYIKFLTQSCQWDMARQTYKKLIPRKGDSYEFWARYYIWELTYWSKTTFKDPSRDNTRPTEATKILQQAIRRPKLDWPERAIDLYRYHCEDHEDAIELQSSQTSIFKAKRALQERREREAIEAYAAAQAMPSQQQQHAQNYVAATLSDFDIVGKRKREDDENEESSKKHRPEATEQAESYAEEQDISAPSQLKRDRENASIVVKNLPPGISNTRLRQYFRDVSLC